MKNIRVYLSDIKNRIQGLTAIQRKTLYLLGASYFFALFSYPMLRSTTTAIFFNTYGAKKSPFIWLFAVIALGIAVSIYNKLQTRFSIHKLFFFTSLGSCIFFFLGLGMIQSGAESWIYPLTVWKEAYIVLLIHMVLGYVNTYVDVDFAKILYGPIGVIGGLGGVLGGILTASLTKELSTEMILATGPIFILVSGIFFYFTDKSNSLHLTKGVQHNVSPLKSIMHVKSYVFLICLLLIVSQFCINLANFKFNVIFDAAVQTKLEKTHFLGNLFAMVNGLSMLTSLIVIPIAFKIFSNRVIHYFIPIFFSITTLIGFGLGGHLLMPVAATFIIFKGLDYSIFNSAKEILYFPLTKRQRFGAKYIVDMIVYRLGKGLISVVLVYFQSMVFINFSLGICLTLWIITLIMIFKVQHRLTKEEI